MSFRVRGGSPSGVASVHVSSRIRPTVGTFHQHESFAGTRPEAQQFAAPFASKTKHVLVTVVVCRMGELKTRFMRGDRYGIHVVAWHAARLLHDLHSRKSSFDGMWTEARDSPVWDDLVVSHGDDTTSWQVKRQMTPLADEELKTIIVGAQAILAQESHGSRNNFKIAFRELKSVHFPQPKGSRGGTKDLELSDLQQLCVDADMPGMQASALVKDTSVPYKHWWPVLESWIGTSDPTLLQDVVRRVQIIQLGDEASLEDQAVNSLTPFYEHPEQVLTSLVQFFTDYPDGRVKVTPQVLAQHVLAPHRPRIGSAIWFDLGLSDTGTRWELRSPRLLNGIARHTWVETSAVDLTLLSPPARHDEVTSQLTRLLLHSNPTTIVRASANTQWAAHATQSCFGTLGTDHSAVRNIATATQDVHHYSPIETFLPRELADRLSTEMNDLVWSSLTATLVTRANELSIEASLRGLLLNRWDTWHSRLKNDLNLRIEFISRLAATEAELTHPQFERLARSGQQLISNAADACLLAVAVAEAFHPGGIDVVPELAGSSGNLALGGIPAHLIAVSYALDRRANNACSLSSTPYFALSVESSILVLGGVSQEPETLRRFWENDATLFTDLDGITTTLDKQGILLPLITFSESLKRSFRGGLQPLQKHIRDVLAPIVDDEYLALKIAIAGVTT